MQVVLGNGSIVDANATSNSDLFRALKGGQGNFGIVTRFDVISYSQTESWGGAILYSDSADAAQLSAFTAFKKSSYDPLAEVEQSFLYYGAQSLFLSTNNMIYTDPVVNASALQHFTDVQPQLSNTMRLSYASDFVEEIEASQPTDQLYVIILKLFFLAALSPYDRLRKTNNAQRNIFNVELPDLRQHHCRSPVVMEKRNYFGRAFSTKHHQCLNIPGHTSSSQGERVAEFTAVLAGLYSAERHCLDPVLGVLAQRSGIYGRRSLRQKINRVGSAVGWGRRKVQVFELCCSMARSNR